MKQGPLCAVALAGLVALSGCATRHRAESLSWVPPQAAADASQLAIEIAGWVDEQAPAATSTILLKPVGRKQANNPVTAELENDLRQMGFGVATSLDASPDALVLRYEVHPIWSDHVILIVQIGDVQATRLFYRQRDGELIPAAPMSLRVML